MRIAVAGGTGAAGGAVVDRLVALGHEPVVLARSTGADLLTGQGLVDRLAGVDAVIDVTSTATSSAKVATEFFTTTTANLLAAGAEAGVRHHVLLSIVGIDDVPFGYYVGKVAQEKLVADAAVPSTIVRATQFHEFAAQVLARMSFAGVAVVPSMRSAPIAVREVGAALVDLAVGNPQGRAPEIGGPRVELMPDLVRRLLRHRQMRRPVIPVRLPGKVGVAMSNGMLIPVAPGTVGTETFDEWLETQS